ncbi:hypothetical protein OC842_005638 [Tilletia horrida]|uniref:Uncharacterized protein n=1 Tax=Tilletia horrida TaxID=155126 RepID=A0AAN6JP59_9BASI|nr:hypothetical protein OC842_005638 [Tilletia horrida]
MMSFMGPPASISSPTSPGLSVPTFATEHRPASQNRKRRSLATSVMSNESSVYFDGSINSHTHLIPTQSSASSITTTTPARLQRDDAQVREEETGAEGAAAIPGLGQSSDAEAVVASSSSTSHKVVVEAENDSEDDSDEEVDASGQRRSKSASKLLHRDSELPRTATSDLADFLKATGPSEPPKHMMDASRSRSSQHFLWDDTPAAKKRGIFSRAKHAVGLRKQRSEHAASGPYPTAAGKLGSLTEEKEREFDTHLRMQNVTKRVLPNGKFYHTLSIGENMTDVDPWQPAPTTSISPPAAPSVRSPAQRSRLSSNVGLSTTSGFKLRSLAGRSTSLSSFADPSVRPISSTGTHAPEDGPSSSARFSTSADVPHTLLGRSDSLRSAKARAGRAVSVSSHQSKADGDMRPARRSAADLHEHRDRPLRSPALSSFSVCTAPAHFKDRDVSKLETSSLIGHGQGQGQGSFRADSRMSMRTVISAKTEFPGLMARAASAMGESSRTGSLSRASQLGSVPRSATSPVPPIPKAPDSELETPFVSAVASPVSTSAVSTSAWLRNTSMFVPVTMGDVDAERSVTMERLPSTGISTGPPSPNPDSCGGPATGPMEILRPSDFAVSNLAERDHIRSKSRSMSTSTATHDTRSSHLLSPTRAIGGGGRKDGGPQPLFRSRSKGDAELRQDWKMPRDAAAVNAILSASALGSVTVTATGATAPATASSEEGSGADEPLPHVVQRALSPPTRKRTGGRPHSRTVSLDSLSNVHQSLAAASSSEGRPSLDSKRSGSTLERSAAAGLKLSLEPPSAQGSVTPVAVPSPLRHTIDMPLCAEADTPVPGLVAARQSPESRRSLILSSKAARPKSTSSAKSDHEPGVSGPSTKRDSRIFTTRQASPSASLEVDNASYGLGLRTSFGQIHGLDLTNMDLLVVGGPKASGSRSGGGVGEPTAAEDEPASLNATSPGPTLWGALEAMRAEFMVSELRAEQERARFRLLARRSADMLELARTALAASKKRGGGLGLRPQGASRQEGAMRRRPRQQRRQLAQLAEPASPKTVQRGATAGPERQKLQQHRQRQCQQQQRRRETQRKAGAVDDETLQAIVLELREYAVSNSPRHSQSGPSGAGAGALAPALGVRTKASRLMKPAAAKGSKVDEPEADWVDVADEQEGEVSAAHDEDANNDEEEDGDATLSDPYKVPVLRSVASASRSEEKEEEEEEAEDLEDEEEDDMSLSHRTDASTDMMGRIDTLSQATTLEDVAGSAAAHSVSASSPGSKTFHRSLSVGSSGGSESAAAAVLGSSPQRPSALSEMSPETFGEARRAFQPASGVGGKARAIVPLEQTDDEVEESEATSASAASSSEEEEGEEEEDDDEDESEDQLDDQPLQHISHQRSPLVSQSPRSFGTISEDGAFYEEDEEFMSASYDEDGPFSSPTGGLMYSLRSTGSPYGGSMGGNGNGMMLARNLSLSRQRRCESMSTIVSEDARSEVGFGGAAVAAVAAALPASSSMEQAGQAALAAGEEVQAPQPQGQGQGQDQGEARVRRTPPPIGPPSPQRRRLGVRTGSASSPSSPSFGGSGGIVAGRLAELQGRLSSPPPASSSSPLHGRPVSTTPSPSPSPSSSKVAAAHVSPPAGRGQFAPPGWAMPLRTGRASAPASVPAPSSGTGSFLDGLEALRPF